MTEKRLFGLIEFSPAISCARNALGNSTEISIGNIPGILTFPRLPDWTDDECSPLQKLLQPPITTPNFKRGNDPLYWGQPISYPAGDGNVNIGVFEFTLSLKDNEFDIAKTIRQNFITWIKLFKKYVVLLTTQSSYSNIIVDSDPNRLEILVQDNLSKTITPVVEDTYITANVIRLSKDVRLHYDQLVIAAEYSSKSLKPKLEYDILLEAYKARGEGDYRKAIIDAASALEVSLIARIEREFLEQNIRHGRKIMKRFAMLSNLFDLARILEIPFPDEDYKQIIIAPRNRVIHKGEFSDSKEATQVVDNVRSLLDHFCSNIFQEI